MKSVDIKRIDTEILIIGGGTAGCYAAITVAENSNRNVLVVEKANIKRSGCLAAGVNALNAYIVKGKTAEDYVDYAKNDAAGIVREDLLLSMAKGLNKVTKKLEDLGLVILKDKSGEYVARGTRNIKINGENIKTILEEAVKKQKNISVLNKINIIDFIVKDNKIFGAIGIGVDDNIIYEIKAKSVICTTGGASGLYRPNNPGFSRHKMWYPPFNTGAGLAMGIRAGAEMTTLEMRFIALRCKDTIAPTGTIAQGVGAKQINSKGELYESKYGFTTSDRVYGTVKENEEGRGPCYLKTEGISEDKDEDLKRAYLNMAPSQTLKWIEEGKGPNKSNVEIEGTEPYIVGGHTASGYWIDTNRRTTIEGLYAAGDVAGGCPQKYVTGALVEGEIAAMSALSDFNKNANSSNSFTNYDEKILLNEKKNEIESMLNCNKALFNVEQLEETMQKAMDLYAGGISKHYKFNEKQLNIADKEIDRIERLSYSLGAEDMHEVMFIYELRERLVLCKSLIAHLRARKETRWHTFCENLDYPERNDEWLKYVNSRFVDGEIKIIIRDLVKRGENYEHIN